MQAVTVWPKHQTMRRRSMTNDIHSHPFAFPETAIDDLRERLSRTRWPEKETVDDWSQGAPLRKMQALCDYWRNEYDWRACRSEERRGGKERVSRCRSRWSPINVKKTGHKVIPDNIVNRP